MRIRYLGHSCFECITKNNIKIITDPYTKVGYELPEDLTADFVTVSHGHFDHAYLSAINGSPKIIQNKLSFSEKGVTFKGVKTYHDSYNGKLRGENIVYLFKVDGITLCHLGDLGEECSNDIAQSIGKIDVLFIPIGGTYTIDAKQAKAYVDKLEPKVVIPMHYRSKDGVLDLQDEKAFLNLFDKKVVSYVDGTYDIESFIGIKDTKIIFMERVK